MKITGHEISQVKDPFGILEGERYEVMLTLEIPEDDELYTEAGVMIRVIYRVAAERSGIVQYELQESGTNRFMNLELEEEELSLIAAYCDEHCKSKS